MPLKASIGLSRKLGQENYGSIGAHCQLEAELDANLIEDADAFQNKVRRLYTLANQAINDQLARYTNGNGGGPTNTSVRSNGTSQNSGSNGSNGTNGEDALASNKQIKYLLDLARQQHDMNLTQAGEFCQQLVGVGDVYRLTKAQASLIIDRLAGNSGNGTSRGNGNGRARVNGRR